MACLQMFLSVRSIPAVIFTGISNHLCTRGDVLWFFSMTLAQTTPTLRRKKRVALEISGQVTNYRVGKTASKALVRGNSIAIVTVTVKPVLRGHLRTFPSVRLIEGVRLIEVVKIAQCLLTINIQQLLCTTVLKSHVVKEAIRSSRSLPFSTNFNLFVNPKTLTVFSTYFKDVIQYYYCH